MRWRRRVSVDLPPGAVDVAASTEVTAGAPHREVTVAGERLLVARRDDGSVVAFDATCPHLGKALRRASSDGAVVTCEKHAYTFDLHDGRCLWPGGPHDHGLTLREAGEVDGRVWVQPTSPPVRP